MATHSIANVALLVNQSSTVAVKTVGSNGSAAQIGVVHTERQAVAVAQTQETEVPREALEKVVSQLKEYVQNLQRDMDFQVDDVTGRVVITVIDSHTNTVIRQIPTEEALAISRHLAELLADEPKGFLIELKA